MSSYVGGWPRVPSSAASPSCSWSGWCLGAGAAAASGWGARVAMGLSVDGRANGGGAVGASARSRESVPPAGCHGVGQFCLSGGAPTSSTRATDAVSLSLCWGAPLESQEG
eukprot:5891307-Prymnesium_polylepis.1